MGKTWLYPNETAPRGGKRPEPRQHVGPPRPARAIWSAFPKSVRMALEAMLRFDRPVFAMVLAEEIGIAPQALSSGLSSALKSGIVGLGRTIPHGQPSLWSLTAEGREWVKERIEEAT